MAEHRLNSIKKWRDSEQVYVPDQDKRDGVLGLSRRVPKQIGVLQSARDRSQRLR